MNNYNTNIRDLSESLRYKLNKIYAIGGDVDSNFIPINTPYFTSKIQGNVQIPFKSRKVSDEQLVDEYIDKVIWKMENPSNKGYNKDTGLYSKYLDKDKEGNVHINIGPGLEKNGHPNIDYNKSYTRDEIDNFSKATVQNRVYKMSKSLSSMQNGKYAEARDTLSLGPLLSLVDIAYNVKTDGKINLPEKWPKLVKNLAEGNIEEAKKETYSGSTRRQKMRNDLITWDAITDSTVVNR